MKQEELLNFNEDNQKAKKSIKKPLIIGGIAFLVFVGGVIGYALISNKEDNVVLPPKVAPKTNQTHFKQVPIVEEKKAPQNKAQNKIKIEDIVNTEKKETKKINIIEKPEKKALKSEPKKVVLENKKKSLKTPHVQYYVQVLALLKHKAPDKRFLELIKKEGFNYTFYKTYYIKNNEKIPVTKVLIGPFKNEKIAREQLKIIRERITKNSFLFKVK